MAETLGMLCDKLTIVKLKEYHSEDPQKLESLAKQATQLQQGMDEYVQAATVLNLERNKCIDAIDLKLVEFSI